MEQRPGVAVTVADAARVYSSVRFGTIFA